jgi:hypothetical protein
MSTWVNFKSSAWVLLGCTSTILGCTVNTGPLGGAAELDAAPKPLADTGSVVDTGKVGNSADAALDRGIDSGPDVTGTSEAGAAPDAVVPHDTGSVVVASCAVGNGGCDPNATCMSTGSGRTSSTPRCS